MTSPSFGMCLNRYIKPMSKISIIPQPVSIEETKGFFLLDHQTAIIADSSKDEAEYLRTFLSQATGFTFNSEEANKTIELSLNGSSKLGNEGYTLEVTPHHILLKAHAPAGLFYACQTLCQLCPVDIYSAKKSKNTVWKIPCVKITDVPRFAWRGAMLDVSRHFMPIEFIKKLLDILALHKLNTFHWHLTDDQGWRIEIKKYPKLTSVGAWRKSTPIGHAFDRPRRYRDERYGGFYTQKEIRDVVAYAQARHITIVPEIDMPGHMQAAIAAYPELGTTTAKLETYCHWGISQSILNVEQSTVTFMQNVLAEVIDLFPGSFIHVGGDEALKHEWSESRRVQDKMLELGLTSEDELQSWFIGQMNQFIQSKGRRMIGWDEILEGGLSRGASVMSWRGIKGGIKAAKAGHDVVMAPTTHTYLDYYQSKNRKLEPLSIGGYLPLEQVYSFEPIPAELSAKKAKHILGVQAQLWTEYISTPSHAEYMYFPRLCALSEVAWSPIEHKNFAGFKKRLTTHLQRLETLVVNYHKPGSLVRKFRSKVKR
jgi:hexosaminidase